MKTPGAEVWPSQIHASLCRTFFTFICFLFYSLLWLKTTSVKEAREIVQRLRAHSALQRTWLWFSTHVWHLCPHKNIYIHTYTRTQNLNLLELFSQKQILGRMKRKVTVIPKMQIICIAKIQYKRFLKNLQIEPRKENKYVKETQELHAS